MLPDVRALRAHWASAMKLFYFPALRLARFSLTSSAETNAVFCVFACEPLPRDYSPNHIVCLGICGKCVEIVSHRRDVGGIFHVVLLDCIFFFFFFFFFSSLFELPCLPNYQLNRRSSPRNTRRRAFSRIENSNLLSHHPEICQQNLGGGPTSDL